MKIRDFFFTLLLLLMSLVFMNSCDKESTLGEEIVINNLMNVTINGEKYQVINDNVGGNENCDNLHISTYYLDNNKIKFRLNISVSKTGQLIRLRYDETILSGQPVQVTNVFLPPNFNILQTFSISNFNYNSITGALKFSFSGTVFKDTNNNETRELQGNIEIKSFLEVINCSVAKTGLSYFSETLNLYSIANNATKYSDNTQLHRFFTNNGYNLDIHVEQDFWNIPIGVIQFNETSTQNKVFLRKLQGGIIANQYPNANDHTWLEYTTKGEIIIENKSIENGAKKITGKINLEIYENSTLINTLNNIDFSTTSFEN